MHRPIVDDILVTSGRRLNNSRFSVTVQWPHNHGYFTANRGRHRLILTAETIRGAGRTVATGHSYVTVASPAVYRRIRGERLAARRALGPLPTSVSPRLTGSATEHDVLHRHMLPQPATAHLAMTTGHGTPATRIGKAKSSWVTSRGRALVTGSSRGIGHAIAQRLTQGGALVAVHYGSNDTAAKATGESITSAGGHHRGQHQGPVVHRPARSAPDA